MAYRVFKAVVGPLLRLLFRIRVDGLDRVPKTGPVILASNHTRVASRGEPTSQEPQALQVPRMAQRSPSAVS